MKLVTIVCESYAREPVTQLLRIVGANGWTLFPVEGEGSHGKRFADIQESANIQIEVIVPPEVSAQLLEKLSDELFAPKNIKHFALYPRSEPVGSTFGE